MNGVIKPAQVCNVSASTGLFSNCVGTTGETTFNNQNSPSVLFNPNGNQAYISSYKGFPVAACTINPDDGTFTGCINAAAGEENILKEGIVTYIAINNSTNKLYFTNYVNSTVSVCDIDFSTGKLSNCKASGTSITNPLGIIIE